MYIILFIVVLLNAVVLLDQTVLPVTLPTIQKEFLSSDIALHWIVDGYFLSLAAFMLAAGKIADIFGHRRIFIIGMFLFALSSFFCGLAQSSEFLIIIRIVQGIGGALMIPPALPILLLAFPENKKGFVVGLVVTFSSIFMILGPFVGGFFSQFLGWRYIFWINLPICFVGILLSLVFIPKSTVIKRHFEFLGFSSYTLGVVFLTIAFIQMQSWGWTSFAVILLLILGVTFLSLLYFVDKKASSPFIDFSLFKNKIFNQSALNIFSTAFALIITVFLPIYLQRNFSFSPSKTGYYMMLSSIPIILSPIAGKMMDRFGLRKVIIPIQIGLMSCFVCIALLVPVNSFWLIFPFLFILTAGVTSIFTCSFAAGIGSVELNNRGEASGLLGTIRSLGINFGVAIIGSLIGDVQKNVFTKQLMENDKISTLDPKVFENLMEGDSIANRAFESLSPSIQTTITDFFQHSYRIAFLFANIAEATIIFIVLIGTFVFLKRKKRSIS